MATALEDVRCLLARLAESELDAGEREAVARELEASIQRLRGSGEAESTAAPAPSELHFRTLFELSRDCVFVLEGMRFISANRAACKLFRMSRDELLGLTPFDLSPERQANGRSSRELGESYIAAAIRGETVSAPWRHQRLDGSVFDSENTSRAFTVDGRQYIYSLVRDTTEQVEASTRLKYQASLLDNLNDAVISTDLDFGIVSWNEAATRLYGWPAEDAIGGSMADIVPTEYPNHDGAEVLQQFQRDGRWEGEVVQRDRGGEAVHVFSSVAVLRDEAGAPIGAVAVNRDITERRHLEQQLLQAQKMEAVGQLAGGIAHDFNNLLTVIRYYSDMAVEDLVPGDPLRADLEEVLHAASKAADLTKMLLTFSRRNVVNRTGVDLGVAVERFAKMAARILGEAIELRVAVPSRPAWVTFDRTQLDQVFMNMVTNAKDAMPEGGALSFEVSNVELSESEARVRPGLAPGPHVQLAVRDTGAGMPDEVRARVFEPFFTTKESGRGTGLGLATVLGIVQQNHGHVGVESEPGAGTQFTFLFSRRDEGASETDAPSPSASVGGSETLLVVEDEPAILELMVKLLSAHGYTVVKASHPGEALLAHELHEGEIQLLLTDVMMPGIRGDELAARLTKRSPAMKVLYMTGHPHDGLDVEGDLIVVKPFDATELLRRIRALLDQG